MLEHLNDNTELEAIRRGDESVFDAVFRRYYEPLCLYAARLLGGDLDDAEDVVQQCFVKLWEKHAVLDINWSVKSYLYKTVHNTCLNRLRHAQTKNKYQQFNAGQLENNHSYQDQGSQELNARFQEALDDLPPQCRHIFELSRFEELKYREIAEALDISIKTVETQMGKALRVLRLRLSDYLVTFFGVCFALLQL